MKLHPHEERMWAVIGVYGGREEHTLQIFDESNQRLRKARGVSHWSEMSPDCPNPQWHILLDQGQLECACKNS